MSDKSYQTATLWSCPHWMRWAGSCLVLQLVKVLSGRSFWKQVSQGSLFTLEDLRWVSLTMGNIMFFSRMWPVWLCVHRIRTIFKDHNVDKSGCLDLCQSEGGQEMSFQAVDEWLHFAKTCMCQMITYQHVTFCRLPSSSQVPVGMLEEVMLKLD